LKGKLRPFLMILSIIIFASAASFFVGRQFEMRKALLEQKAAIKDNESTEIAVVNQDLGTNYKDKNVNYASEFVKSLDEDFVLTNRDAGKNGLKDGKYAAMVIIPGNFSQNVTTINDVTPSKVEIYYETNDELSKENKLIASAKISDLQNKLNNKLSYIYVSAVFDELHKGQDYVSDALKNDNADLEAINSINDADILESINLTQLKDEDIDIKDLDLNKNFEDNKDIIKDIDKKYRDRLIAKEKRFSEIEDELIKLTGNDTTGIQSFRSKIENMTPKQLKEALAKKHNYNYAGLSDNYDVNVKDINKYIEGLTKDGGEIDNLFSTYNRYILDDIDNKGKSAIDKSNEAFTKSKENMNSTLDTMRNDSMGELNNLKSNIINGYINDPKLKSLNEEYLLYGEIVRKLKETNLGEFENLYKNVVDENKVDYSKILKNPIAGFTPENTFSNSNELKQYMNNMPEDKKDTYILERSSLYKGTDVNDSTLSANIKLVDDVTDQLNVAQNKLEEASKLTNSVINNSDYKYISDLFSKDAKTTLGERLKLKENLLKEVKENLGGNNQKSLVSTMQSNNKTNVDDVKDKVEDVVEATVANDGPIDINGLLKIFDENYMSRFNNLINKVDDLGKTPQTVEEDKKVSNLWSKYDKSNEALNDSVTKQIENYRQVADNSRDNANKQVTAMEEDLQKGIQSSQDKLSSGLKNAKDSKESTTESNKEKLGSLTTVLLNSRVGTVENTDMYNFIINPLYATRTENLLSKAPEQKVTNDYNNIDIKIAMFSLSCFLIVATTLVVFKKRKISK